MTRFDQEIHEVEARIERERHALASAAARAGHSAKCSLTNPKALLVAAGIGYVLGELIQRPKKVVRAVPVAAQPGKIGVWSLLGALAAALLRASGYGNPVALAQSLLSLGQSGRSPRKDSSRPPRHLQAPALYR